MSSFLDEPEPSSAQEAMYAEDRAGFGFVMNLSRVWGHHPPFQEGLMGTAGGAAELAGLTLRERGVLVAACAATIGDSYCALAWGGKLAEAADDADLARSVLCGEDIGLSERELALARWARAVAGDPAGTAAADVQRLRDAGWTDREILAITVFVASRIAFSTVNAALGAHPDAELTELAPGSVVEAVTWGRPVSPG